MKYQPIGNYGMIGDLHTVALVGMDGAIDFLCFPRFDSPTIFAALLDHERGGRFQIAPVGDGEFGRKQLYLPDTNILLTRFLAAAGVAELSDFMPARHGRQSHNVIRRLKVVRGEIRFRMTCAPRFDYARAEHTVEKRQAELLFCSRGADKTALRLRTTVPVRVANGAAMAEFTLRAGQTAAFILEDAQPDRESPSAANHYIPQAFKATMNFWQRWVARSQYRGRWRETVNRSALVLKLLTSQADGAIVAAPTFGLPEQIGGARNWDYRYTWIRDASFTIDALLRLGYTEEATAFIDWLEQRRHHHARTGPLQTLYGIDGRGQLRETALPHLSGYRDSRPVRIGNAAARQLQLDIYGELLDAVYLHQQHGAPLTYDLWQWLAKLVDWVCVHWRQADDCIWEVRGGPHPFLYSRVMCWVALDRGLHLAAAASFPAPLARWQRVRDQIYRDIYQHFWNPKLRAFVQYRGSQIVDAASLLLPLVNFIAPTDPRWCATLGAIRQSLIEDALVHRYNEFRAARDGLTGQEGTFSACSFWYVQCLARAGDLKLARFILEKMLGYANHLGLYAEQLGPRGEQLGNFPQALTHIALINAACDLNQRLEQAHHP